MNRKFVFLSILLLIGIAIYIATHFWAVQEDPSKVKLPAQDELVQVEARTATEADPECEDSSHLESIFFKINLPTNASHETYAIASPVEIDSGTGEVETSSILMSLVKERAEQTNEKGEVRSQVYCKKGADDTYQLELGAYNPKVGTAYIKMAYSEIKKAALAGRPIELSVERGNVISGKIVDSKKMPIEGASIKIAGSSVGKGGVSCQGLWAESSSDGSFQISGIRFDNAVSSISIHYPRIDYKTLTNQKKQYYIEHPQFKRQIRIANKRDPVTGDWDVGEIVLDYGAAEGK